ncbi:hypothetical protein QF032_001360 [Streptomyces achromogenes]|uniref:hypothetical protein n=1 Tax=Streptomyces achromogenes TaxID=67255 RepID=UPI002783BC09|nr:hypothetical protein [Streptomyces achromogenes]MDQ0829516.1 hypothetical protein [Streptomyces achromogenes]
MTHLPASSAAEPRHVRGGAGGAGRGQQVPYPLRLVLDADTYAPVDTNVYGKWRALSSGRRATASVAKVAGYIVASKSTVERSTRRLGTPAPTDGVTEVFTKRQTHKGTGTGQTAERWCRELDKGEAYVWAPVLAADTMRGILHRLYLGLRYAIGVRGHQPTLAELAQLLRHHGGKLAGQPLAEASVSRLLDELAELGWITLERRAGYRGRHLITVHDHPVHPVEEPDATPDPGDGSGPDLGDGSLAYREYLELNDVRTTQVGGSFRRRRGDRKWVAPPVDNSGPSLASVAPAALRAPTTPAVRPQGGPTYDGPALALSPRVWDVLEPVRDLLPAATTFMVRKIAREVGRQLDSGIWPDDIRDQLQRLRAWTPPEDIRDPGRWIYGAALPARPGPCGRPGCHYGFQHHTGMPCKACADARAHPPPPTWHECTECQRPARRPLPAGLCDTCRPAGPITA